MPKGEKADRKVSLRFFRPIRPLATLPVTFSGIQGLDFLLHGGCFRILPVAFRPVDVRQPVGFFQEFPVPRLETLDRGFPLEKIEPAGQDLWIQHNEQSRPAMVVRPYFVAQVLMPNRAYSGQKRKMLVSRKMPPRASRT